MSIERIKALKEKAMSLAEQGLNQDVSCMDAKEVGEVVDMVKDLSEACYYANIVEAMEKSDEEEKYMEKYLPEMAYARNYSDGMRRGNMNPRYYTPYTRMYPIEPGYDRMYYTVGKGNMPRMNYSDKDNHNAEYDGESWQYRRNYMESKEMGKEDTSSDFEKYLKSLGEDIIELYDDMTPQERQMAKQKFTTLASKM